MFGRISALKWLSFALFLLFPLALPAQEPTKQVFIIKLKNNREIKGTVYCNKLIVNDTGKVVKDGKVISSLTLWFKGGRMTISTEDVISIRKSPTRQRPNIPDEGNTEGDNKTSTTGKGKKGVHVTQEGTRALYGGFYTAKFFEKDPQQDSKNTLPYEKVALQYNIRKYKDTGEHDFQVLEQKMRFTPKRVETSPGERSLKWTKSLVYNKQLTVSTDKNFVLQGFRYTLRLGTKSERRIEGEYDPSKKALLLNITDIVMVKKPPSEIEKEREEGKTPNEDEKRAKITRKKQSLKWKPHYILRNYAIFKFLIENRMNLSAVGTYIVFDVEEFRFGKMYLSLDPRSFNTNYLFTLPETDKSKKALNDGILSEAIRNKFKENKIDLPLNQNIDIKATKPGREWEVTGNIGKWLVQMEEKNLNVYELRSPKVRNSNLTEEQLIRRAFMRKMLKRYHRVEAKVSFTGGLSETRYFWLKKGDSLSPTNRIFWIQRPAKNRVLYSEDYLKEQKKNNQNQ